MATIIRDYRPEDREGAYHVCLKTGYHGDDGEPYFQEDPDALGRIFVEPYFRFQPDLALILEDELGVCGYALGAIDSNSFYERYEREWRPTLCMRFPDPGGGPATWTTVQLIYHFYHHPDYFCPPPYEQYPSHLHIDLLPRKHRQGFGVRMMNELMRRLQDQGSPGVHLGLDASNDRAHKFYVALGFHDLARRGEGEQESIYMGKRFLT